MTKSDEVDSEEVLYEYEEDLSQGDYANIQMDKASETNETPDE